MDKRLELHAKLVEILGSDHVYFQPPMNFQLVYPCIVYTRDPNRVYFANNAGYISYRSYTVTYIDPDPDTTIPDRLAALPFVSGNRFFMNDNLNHYVFKVYF